jgi:hypothetical protein
LAVGVVNVPGDVGATGATGDVGAIRATRLRRSFETLEASAFESYGGHVVGQASKVGVTAVAAFHWMINKKNHEIQIIGKIWY